MVEYECKKCNKRFSHKSDYTRHMNRKYSCTIASLKCDGCGKSFKHSSSLYRHVKKCGNGAINITNNNLQHITNTKIDKQVNNNLKVGGDVRVVKFGNENLSYISNDIFKQILGRGFKAVEELIDHSHFNKDHPENHNIYIANIKNDYVIIYDGDKWTINKKDDVMEDIIYAKSDFLYTKFQELMSEMNQNDITKFTNFINQRDEDQTMNRLKEELKLQLYNNRQLPQRLRKKLEANERLKLGNKKVKKIKNASSTLDNVMSMLENLDESKLKKMEELLNRL